MQDAVESKAGAADTECMVELTSTTELCVSKTASLSGA